MFRVHRMNQIMYLRGNRSLFLDPFGTAKDQMSRCKELTRSLVPRNPSCWEMGKREPGSSQTADTASCVATALMERLGTILPDGQQGKLIAQAYDGAAVMRGAKGGVQRKRTAILDQVVAHRLPGTSTTRWNFHSRAVNTVYEQKENILKCFQTIRDSGDFDPITAREAGGFVRMMEDEAFCFFLTLFHDIMPHADMLFSQLQKRIIDSVYIKGLIKRFTSSIQAIRRSPPARRVTPRVIVKGEVAKSPQPDPSKWTVIGQGRKRSQHDEPEQSIDALNKQGLFSRRSVNSVLCFESIGELEESYLPLTPAWFSSAMLVEMDNMSPSHLPGPDESIPSPWP
ncbi:hypothetical protein KUCAC02_031457 [Chaenocephalus aceratus]|nr:hypothetical protein KUCAC02_031457 [Chaenocephalus aceratus]